MELVAAYNKLGDILWTRYFIKAQGYTVDHNIVYQDNMSTLSLEKNVSGSDRTKHIKAHYFLIKKKLPPTRLLLNIAPQMKCGPTFSQNPYRDQKSVLCDHSWWTAPLIMLNSNFSNEPMSSHCFIAGVCWITSRYYLCDRRLTSHTFSWLEESNNTTALHANTNLQIIIPQLTSDQSNNNPDNHFQTLVWTNYPKISLISWETKETFT